MFPVAIAFRIICQCRFRCIQARDGFLNLLSSNKENKERKIATRQDRLNDFSLLCTERDYVKTLNIFVNSKACSLKGQKGEFVRIILVFIPFLQIKHVLYILVFIPLQTTRLGASEGLNSAL